MPGFPGDVLVLACFRGFPGICSVVFNVPWRGFPRFPGFFQEETLASGVPPRLFGSKSQDFASRGFPGNVLGVACSRGFPGICPIHFFNVPRGRFPRFPGLFQDVGLFLAGSRDVFLGVTPRVWPRIFEECPRVKMFPREFPDFLFPFHLAVFPGREFPREFSGKVPGLISEKSLGGHLCNKSWEIRH